MWRLCYFGLFVALAGSLRGFGSPDFGCRMWSLPVIGQRWWRRMTAAGCCLDQAQSSELFSDFSGLVVPKNFYLRPRYRRQGFLVL